MNELELLEQAANDLVKRIKELKTKQKEKQEKSVTRWRGNEGDSYWYVDDIEGVLRSYEDSHEADDLRYCTGNYFETEHQCEQYLKNLKTKQKLKDLALKLNNGREIEWGNEAQNKYYIVYDYDSQILKQSYGYHYRPLGQVCCLDVDFLKSALTVIYEDDLINLIKSGV